MSIVCETCATTNRRGAMFCIGCAGQLPGFAPTGPSMLEAVRAEAPARRSTGSARILRERRAFQRNETLRTGAWLGIGGSVLGAMFLAWFLQVTRHPDEAAARRPSPTVVALAPLAASVPSTLLGAPPGPAMAAGHGVEPAHDASTRAVEQFYQALSAGDGPAAAALVTPAKRGVGPFNGDGMSRFYRSLRMPLALGSVRPLGDGVVEARYRYRAASRTCEGTAIVTTEAVDDRTLIRSIRANC